MFIFEHSSQCYEFCCCHSEIRGVLLQPGRHRKRGSLFESWFWGAETFSLFNCTVVLCVLKGWNRLCRFWDWPHGQRGSSSDASVRRPKTPQWCSLCNFLTYFIMSYDFLFDSISSWMYFYFAGKCFHWLYNTDLLKLPSKCFLQINVNNFL